MNSAGRRHVYLAGFMGTGKSVVGKLLATRMGRAFYDLDCVVEEMTQRTVRRIFALEGEQAFRRHEARALRSIVGSAGAVIALGGGAPTVPGIVDLVRQTGYTFLLSAPWDVIWERIRKSSSRPLLDGLGLPGTHDTGAQYKRFVVYADRLLQRRRGAYNDIKDWTIDTAHQDVESVVERVERTLGRRAEGTEAP